MGTGVRKRVLIMDDSAFALQLTAAAIETAGFEAVCARCLSDLDLAGDVDLILMDVEMPEAFGDDVASMIRGGQFREVPTFLFSNLPDDDLARRAKEAGLDGWIPKRSGVGAIVERVKAALGDAPPEPPGPRARRDSEVAAFLSSARGRLRRAQGALRRGDATGARTELHALGGEAALLVSPEVASSAVAVAEAAICPADTGPLEMAVVLAGLERDLDDLARRGNVVEPRLATKRARILVIDDSDVFRSAVMGGLEDIGHEVVEARRLSEARHRVREGEYDVVVVEFGLENGRGSELLPEIREVAPAAVLVALAEVPVPDATTMSRHLGTAELVRRIDEVVIRRAR